MGARTASAGGSRHTPGEWRDRPAGPRATVSASWIAVLLLSAVPAIIAHQFLGSVPTWLTVFQTAIAAGLIILALTFRSLRPLWRYGVTAVCLVTLLWASGLIRWELPVLQDLFGATAFDARMQAEQTGKLAVALGMIGVLLLLRLRAREFFLTPGRLTAPIRPVALLGFPRPDSWVRFGLIWGFGIAATLAVVLFVLLNARTSALPGILPMVPSILFYAALNSFSEEMTYRAPMLATLEPAVGSRTALWQAAVSFGVAHYFGIPGGLIGALLAIFMGWMLSKAMLETRGLFWPWFIHFLSDVAIFSAIALTLT